jgi:hypothetical protein
VEREGEEKVGGLRVVGCLREEVGGGVRAGTVWLRVVCS